VIGAQKSGTSSLHALLHQHPKIWMTPWKECNVLTKRPASRLAYQAFFLKKSARRSLTVRYVGESTPYYLFHPQAPQRATALLPCFTAIVLPRHPVQRAWSHYRHALSLGLGTRPVDDALEAEHDRTHSEYLRVATARDASSEFLRHYSYVARGRYADQLQRWLNSIGSDRLHVILIEDLLDQFDETLRGIEEFLGVEPFESVALPTENENRFHSEPIPPETAARLADTFREDNARLASLLGVNIPW